MRHNIRYIITSACIRGSKNVGSRLKFKIKFWIKFEYNSDTSQTDYYYYIIIN